VVLAVVCLPVILLSLDADAQPTVDDATLSCSASALEEVATEIKKDITDEIRGVKQLIASDSGETKNETSPEEVAKDIKDHLDIVLYLLNDEIADAKKLVVSRGKEGNETRLEEIAKKIEDLKTLLESGSDKTNETTLAEVVNMVRIIASNQRENAKQIGEVKRLLVSGSTESNETSLPREYTCGEMMSHNLLSRYVRHFVGITWHNVELRGEDLPCYSKNLTS